MKMYCLGCFSWNHKLTEVTSIHRVPCLQNQRSRTGGRSYQRRDRKNHRLPQTCRRVRATHSMKRLSLICLECGTTDIIPGTLFVAGYFEICPECGNLVKPPVLSLKESEVRDRITVMEFDLLRLYRTGVGPEGRVYQYRNRFQKITNKLVEIRVWEPATPVGKDCAYQLTPLGLRVLHDLNCQAKERKVK